MATPITVNGYEINIEGVRPWVTREQNVITDIVNLMPNRTAVLAGNTVTANHGHSILQRPDNANSLITGLNTNRIGFLTTNPNCTFHFNHSANGIAPDANTVFHISSLGAAGPVRFEMSSANAASSCEHIFTDGVVAHAGSIQYYFNDSMRFGINNVVYGRWYTAKFIVGNLDVSGIIPDSVFHVMGQNTGATGGGCATFEGDSDSGTAKVYFLCTNDSQFSLNFGDDNDSDIGRIIYDHNFNCMYFMTNNTERIYLDNTGLVGSNTTAPSFSATATAAGNIDINGKAIRIRTAVTPATAGAAGNVGEICWDTSYIYVCIGANSWKRAAIAAGW